MPKKFILRVGLPVLIAFVAVTIWQFLTIAELRSELADFQNARQAPAPPLPNVLRRAQVMPAPAKPPAQSFAADKTFALPIDCTPGRDCWMPNYVDADPGKGARDYTGGARTYDGHKGVDFAIRDRRAMIRGVTVRAAADGVVLAIRDAMADIDYKLLKPETLKGRECGNAVVIRHNADWRTQYCHMRLASVAVVKGQRIKAGRALGLVGHSGKTEFPHLHFMVFYKGQPVDPFTGVTIRDAAKVTGNMWRADARAKLQYRATNIYHAGFAASVPKFQAARRGDYAAARLPARIENLFVWMDIFGVHNGDQITVQLIGPGEKPLATRRLNMKLKRPRARQFLHFGFKARRGSWPAGAYRGEISLTRPASGGPIIFRASRRVTIN
ncbi:MAG: M23 family metallopeptidase [Rhodospirillaceae bacterium]|nr:M23 family metallopeptidase [Rhodospirillaceae bacterium]